jgi:hypothetical protein
MARRGDLYDQFVRVVEPQPPNEPVNVLRAGLGQVLM